MNIEKRRITQRKAQAKYKAANPEKFAALRKKQYQDRNQWFWNLKDGLKCERCPEDHPACLQFHHKDPKEKFKDVSVMVRDKYSVASILKEIAKCIVLCGNCHSKEHYKRVYSSTLEQPALTR